MDGFAWWAERMYRNKVSPDCMYHDNNYNQVEDRLLRFLGRKPIQDSGRLCETER